MKIIFAGTPSFAVPFLQALLTQKQHEVVLVLTQPDRPQGRGMQLQASAVKQTAELAKLTIMQPVTLKHADIQAQIQILQADLAIVVAYGLLLPQTLLQSTRLGWWNIHASLLPRWRGAAPIQRAIEAGDMQTGVCLMQMQLGLDTGDIALCEQMDIPPAMSCGELSNKLADLGVNSLIKALEQPEVIDWQKQSQEGVSYAHKVQKSEALLHFQNSAEVLARKIMAFNPAPTAYAFFRGKRIKIWRAQVIQHHQSPTKLVELGSIVAQQEGMLCVQCAQGLLGITELQPTGAQRINAATFWLRYQVKIGECLLSA